MTSSSVKSGNWTQPHSPIPFSASRIVFRARLILMLADGASFSAISASSPMGDLEKAVDCLRMERDDLRHLLK